MKLAHRIACLALLASACISQAGAASAAEPAISDAAWLAGRWVGEGLGGQVEEVWSPPAGGQMVGHFTLVKEGKPVFYELLLLDVAPLGLRMRAKHFNPDFTAWEDKAGWHSFEPVSARPDSIKFEGLTISRNGDELIMLLTLKAKDGTVTDQPIRFRRSPPGPAIAGD